MVACRERERGCRRHAQVVAELEQLGGRDLLDDAQAEARWYVNLFHPWDGNDDEPVERLYARLDILERRCARARRDDPSMRRESQGCVMRLEIVQVPGCPHAAVLNQRLDEVLADYPGAVQRADRIVEDQDAAAAAGMSGSPTLLVDGVDPFAEPGAAPSVSCRLYRDGNGRPQGAPSVTALRRALGRSVAADQHQM